MTNSYEWVAVYCLTIIVAMAFLNRVRGGGAGYGAKVNAIIEDAEGRPLFYVVGSVFALITVISWDWRLGGIAALGYLIWGIGPWGRMHDLGTLSHEYRKGEPLTDAILRVLPKSVASDCVAMFVRELFVIPCVAGLSYYLGWYFYEFIAVSILFALVAVYLRFMVFHILPVSPRYRVFWAEHLIGAFAWGILLSCAVSYKLLYSGITG